MAIKHEIRTQKGNGETRAVELTPNKAIHYQCVECMGWSSHEVKECTDNHCPLYPFRMGTNPSRRRDQKEPGKIRSKEAILS
jgi:hypothetical protein